MKMPPPGTLATELKILSLVAGTVLVLSLGNYFYSGDGWTLRSMGNDYTGQSPEIELTTEQGADKDHYMSEDLTYRLPKNLLPSKYIIKLRPVLPILPGVETSEGDPLEGFTLYSVPGEVTIIVRCVERTDRIVLHLFNITIHESDIKVIRLSEENQIEHGSSILVTGYDADPVQDFFTIFLGETLERDETYSVTISFESHLSTTNTFGIFVVDYTDPITNETKQMATTKFQATHARHGFPCFDEPEFKAVFEIIIGRTAGYHTLSNWPLNHTTEDTTAKGWYWDHFEPTPKMSVYLVCFAVSDFTSQESSIMLRGNRPVKVWAPKHIIDAGGGKYAADLTARVVTELEDYFNMTDMLPKVDSIMVPKFMTPAMENWGLITYKEDMIIYVPGASADRKLSVTTVVAHELSHHWFGNLVTCAWWSDVWLNEGFATFLSYLVMERLNLGHDPDEVFVEYVLQFTMTSDSQPSARPIRSPAKTPSEIYDMFSTTSYRKGASLIRMMQSFLGRENFRRGLQNFMRKFAFQTASQEDLFHELNLVDQGRLPPGVTVKDVMETWTRQPGYPVVRAELEGENRIRLSQQAFTQSLGEQKSGAQRSWWIPIRLTTDVDPKGTTLVWLPPSLSSVTVNVNASKWIHINTDYGGYFAVVYDRSLSVSLQRQLEDNHSVFSPITRCQILFDHVVAAKANYIPGDSVLNVTRYLDKEIDGLPWTALYYYFHDLQRHLRTSDVHHEAFVGYLLPKVEKVLGSDQVGMEPHGNDSYVMGHFRYSLTRIACRLGSSTCFEVASRIFQKWVDDPTGNPFGSYKNGAEDLLRCAMVRANGEEAWEFMLEAFLNSTDRHAEWVALRAMSCAQTPDLINRTLSLSSNSSLFPDHVLRIGMLSNLVRNKYAATTALDFILENFRGTSATPTAFIDVQDLSPLLTALSEFPCSLDVTSKLQNFAEQNKASLHSATVVSEAINVLQDFQTWMEHYGDLYLDWFKRNTNNQ